MPPFCARLLLALAGSCVVALAVLAVATPARRAPGTAVRLTAGRAAGILADAVPGPAAVPRASRGGLRSALIPTGPSFSGTASWYGGSYFQGRQTANGERFDTHALTAASRTLPFGTRLRVCRGRRCVVVRINDRGPYVGARVLDLSHAAAQRLGYEGVERVTATPVVRRTVLSSPS